MNVFSHKAMDTDFTVRFSSGDERFFASAANACFDRIDALEARLSRFRDDSDVAAIRALRPGEVATVAPETMDVLLASAEVCAATRGAFDPTVGRAMDVVRDAVAASAGDARREDLSKLLERGGLSRLVLDPEHLRLTVKPRADGAPDESLSLDFGGVGKGYALDECAKILKGEQYELDDFLLDAGGSTVLACGPGPDGDGWKLGVGGRWRDRASKVSGSVRLRDFALSGSGFEVQGAHIIDTRQHARAGRWAQSWAVASSGAVADALTTASLAMSAAEIRTACEELHAGVMVAREQPRAFDRLRSPLVVLGDWPA